MTSDADRQRLAVLVHEVRSPVAALAAVARTFADSELDESDRRSLVALAAAACRGIERVVTDATVASVRLERVDAALLVREAVGAAALGGARVRAEIEGLKHDALAFEADPLRLRQALDNLISNAILHGGEGGEVVVTARRADSHLVFAVTDAGPGIPAVEHERIFEAGVRLREARPGSGLGLAVARAIAEAHGGTLAVESVLGRGSTFSLAIPV